MKINHPHIITGIVLAVAITTTVSAFHRLQLNSNQQTQPALKQPLPTGTQQAVSISSTPAQITTDDNSKLETAPTTNLNTAKGKPSSKEIESEDKNEKEDD